MRYYNNYIVKYNWETYLVKKSIVEFYKLPNKLKTVEKNLLKMKSEKKKVKKKLETCKIKIKKIKIKNKE